MPLDGTVYVVDDDPDIRKALTASLEMRGHHVENYASAEEFLDSFENNHIGCLVLDIKMPGINGLQLQQILSEKNYQFPIIFVTGHGDIPMSVQALKNGAVDFLEKPYRQEHLHSRIEQALAQSKKYMQTLEKENKIFNKYASLTPREKQIMHLLTSNNGKNTNKIIAQELNISPRTVEDHRARIMGKMRAASIIELMKMSKICIAD